ncbi:trypsin-like serine peptidase [Saccharothrix syringae]|uniref:trypsin-like serine peptidase n=1 Tax=Saccharothrix syringae TaxID=103733 RepID=UPI00147783A7|nr:trypsin-like serine protease [Saccharothrix syringae]
MNANRSTLRAGTLLSGALLVVVVLSPTASAGAAENAELAVTDTGGVSLSAAASTGLRGLDSHEGTGVPKDVTAYGAEPVPAGHRIQGYRSPTGDDVGVQSIIGADNRTRVDPTTSFPARATVLITRTVNGVESQHCTGWMFSDDLVVTAGHCVYDQSTGWYTGRLRFYPGANGAGSYPYGSCSATTLRSNTGWTVDGSADADYGAATLNCTIGNTTGWYGAYWTTASLLGTATTIQGYPGDKGSQQWIHSDQVRQNGSLRLYYDNDTVGGNSGSSVYTVRAAGSSGCSGRCSLAIHAYGVGSSTHNSGPRITESRFNLIAGWR